MHDVDAFSLSVPERLPFPLCPSRPFAFDAHVDTLERMFLEGFDPLREHEAGAAGASCLDLPRMVRGGLSAAFFAAFIPQGPLTAEGWTAASARADSMLDCLDAMVCRASSLCGKAASPIDVLRLHREGRIAIVPALENGYPLGEDLGKLDHFWARGVRYMTLCHFGRNWICGSSLDAEEGLTPFGVRLVARMNELGMMVDVSHASEPAFNEVLHVSRAPIIASHSNARALCDSSRNLTDGQLKALASKNGVVHACLVQDFLKSRPQDSEVGIVSVADYVDHIDHLVEIAGEDHVGIGTDFDGGAWLADCADVAELPRVLEEMRHRNYPDSLIEKIWGGNLLCVWRDVLDVASK